MTAWDALVLPGTPEYERVHRPRIERFHGVRPRAVVRCASEADVVRALEYAGDGPLAVRSGGHCFAGRAGRAGRQPGDHGGAATRVSVFGAALAGEGATRAMLDGLVRAAGARPAGSC